MRKALICKLCGEPRDWSIDLALCTKHKKEYSKEKTKATRANMSDSDKAEALKKMREYHFRTRLAKYGLTEADYQALLIAQGMSCGICLSKEPGGKGDWHLDHDHFTGKIRGLLCQTCNCALGLFKDSISNLNRAIGYLSKSLQS